MKPVITKSIHANRMILSIGILAAGLFPSFGAGPASELSLSQYVNPFIGTEPSPGSEFGIAFDTGNVFPGAVAPRGMLAWSPDTTHASQISSGYWYPDPLIEGFSLTHFSGRGVTCLKDIPFMPTLLPVTASPGTNFVQFASSFSHKNESAAPGYYRVRLDNGIETELTVSLRAGLAQFHFPAQPPATLLIRAGSSVSINGNEVSGFRNTAIGGGKRPYTIYFSARFEQPFRSVRTWKNNDISKETEVSSRDCGAILTFDPSKSPTVRVRVGISYVSVANARANLTSEIPEWNFDAVRQKADAAWNVELNRIQVEGGDDARKRAFYTALYHCFIHPNLLDDVKGQYPGMDEKIHSVEPGRHQYQNVPGWDQYRSHSPLMAILVPQESSDVMQSLVNYARQDASARTNGGGQARWQQVNRNSGGMIGDGPPIIIASSHAFGATRFDRRGALAAMHKGASQPGMTSDGFEVRKGLQDYLNLGYVPDAVSVTLEYCNADYALAQFARALGDQEKYARYLKSAQNWTNLFDAETSLLRPRYADGSWHKELSQGEVTDMRQTYVEASPEQTLWMVNFNLRELIEQIGGPEKATARLDRFFTQLNAGMRADMAYMGNEPCEGIPWTYTFTGAPARTQKVVRRIQDELFTDQPSGLPGNDDAGSLSSWYVFSALGLYPMIPGVGGLSVGSPLFPKATIHLQNGAKIEIIGKDASAETCYVQSLKLNGRDWQSPWIPWSALSGGGTIHFTLGNKPSAWGAEASQPDGNPPKPHTAHSAATATIWPKAPLGEYQPAFPRKIDPSTLYGKLVFGYQGWFSAAGDGGQLNNWNHWSVNQKKPNDTNARVQMWPDLSEFDADELYDTDLRYPDGSVAKVYSASSLKTVMRHFRWMQDYNLDGAMHYRFISSVSSRPKYRGFFDKVLDNVRRSAEAYGRVFAVQYDISDYRGPSVVKDIQKDWKSLLDDMKITESPMYLHHKGRPLLVLRNFGNSGGKRLITPAEAAELIKWFKTDAPEEYRVTLMGALPGYWRTQGSDVKPDPGWPAVFRSFDVVSAWPVGRFSDEVGARKWMENVVLPDMKECARIGIDYIPAIYPSYSYHNANQSKPYNAIPRLGGRFYWWQVDNVVSANATMMYNAIFDEIDEGTAMYKVSPSAATQPVMPENRRFLPLDADGEKLPSDWYLKLADYAGRALRKDIVPTAARPIDP